MKFTIDPKCIRYTNIRLKTRQLSKKFKSKFALSTKRGEI